MFRRLVNFVLAILMLMPAGICTCDGGVVSCPDHAVQTPTQTQEYTDPVQASGVSRPADSSGTVRDSQAHQCPAPRPHQPSCRVAAPEFLTDASVSDLSISLHIIDFAVVVGVVGWPTPQPSRFDRHTSFTPLPASPIYLANCVLLI